ncbi:hypothetical protein GCM10010441_51130 [Kitasatospora paracochleata]|uniref:Component of type VI protein secretion system n=1 Tax=Kitasatospora paracochleata TaxID=58354 RepID=A0ABT1IS70_9ACTN|nr:hypothetical protein [Kitasatospora paracochleata]MCP2307783.1 putative component of type VI protein secretion system [Kitasatospora paracochleata]
MHATVASPLLSHVSAALSGSARAVALYASDMSNTCRFSTAGEVQVEAWIAQGVARLGLERVRSGGEFLRSYNLRLIGCGDGQPDDDTYRQWFPSKRRATRAQDLAGMLALVQADRAAEAERLATVIPFPRPQAPTVVSALTA